MRDEKEERKKQARSNKQTRQSNTAHPRQSHVHAHTESQQAKLLYKVTVPLTLQYDSAFRYMFELWRNFSYASIAFESVRRDFEGAYPGRLQAESL